MPQIVLLMEELRGRIDPIVVLEVGDDRHLVQVCYPVGNGPPESAAHEPKSAIPAPNRRNLANVDSADGRETRRVTLGVNLVA